ncbi:hypothetical protein INN71_13345 [Nocardioides sp. ChNu-153]|uniref:hypothetical protein n=1 Tax=unclassified Nocardioides TaxID=2615069 RepID=UPI002406A266|nr:MULTISPECIES: hypothetical protein [unclassified Nocardioides]MDF9715105.1 hypothetical protein [Nocardioides sp. ChNu-99]MDN7122375.1 hypothetical protein [Nocardioides sp. ChNu-153]
MRGGKRAGSRRESTAAPRPRGRLAALALGITVTVVAWGYLVWVAIDFGATARAGEGAAWWFVALASLGAIACLFIALLLGAAALRTLGGPAAPTAPESPPRPSGGKRAAR